MSNGFIQLPRSLLEHPSVKKAPAEQFKVLIILISNLRYSPELFDDHGLIFEVQKGEFCTTYDELAKLAEVDRNHAVRAIKRFSKPTNFFTFDKQIFKSQILTYEVKRKKTLIKLLHQDTYDLLIKQSEMKCDTKVKRSRNESEMQKNKDNKVNKEKEKNNKKENPEKIAFREWVFLTQSEYDKLLARVGQQRLDLMLDILDGYNTQRQKCYPSDYGAMKKNSWVEKRASEGTETQKPFWEIHREIATKASQELKSQFYEIRVNGAEASFIALQGQQAPFTLKFSDKGFRESFNVTLKDKGFKRLQAVQKIELEAI